MAAGQGLDLPSIARAILASVEDHFAASGVQLPQRRVIAAGAPELVAWDCPMVIVACSGVGTGPAPGVGGAAQQTGRPVAVGARHALFAVQIVRKHPEATPVQGSVVPPKPDKITEAGVAHLRDMGLLSQALVELCANPTFRDVISGSAEVGAVSSVGPEGGFAGVQGSIAVTAGYLA